MYLKHKRQEGIDSYTRHSEDHYHDYLTDLSSRPVRAKAGDIDVPISRKDAKAQAKEGTVPEITRKSATVSNRLEIFKMKGSKKMSKVRSILPGLYIKSLKKTVGGLKVPTELILKSTITGKVNFTHTMKRLDTKPTDLENTLDNSLLDTVETENYFIAAFDFH